MVKSKSHEIPLNLNKSHVTPKIPLISSKFTIKIPRNPQDEAVLAALQQLREALLQELIAAVEAELIPAGGVDQGKKWGSSLKNWELTMKKPDLTWI